MEKYIIPMLKALAFLSEEDSAKPMLRGELLLPDDRKILMVVNRKHQLASLFPAELKEPLVAVALSPIMLLHYGKDSGKLCGITITDMDAFITDWECSGGIGSILPALRKFAGAY